MQLIDQTGANVGVVPIAQAMSMAADAEMDLVEINAAQIPPVVKIMDYGKFKYDQKKKANEAKKKQKLTELKEIWIKPFIEENDFNLKMKKVFEFLNDGDKVKVAIMTKGSRKVLARGRDSVPVLFEKILSTVEGKGILESKSKPEDRTKSIIIAPLKIP